MITKILRAPVGAGSFYYALRLAEKYRIEAGYQKPVSIIAQAPMLEQCKRISERQGIETGIITTPERWLRHHAGIGDGIVLVESLYPISYRRISQTLLQCPREYWLVNPPAEIGTDSWILQSGPPRRIDR